MPYTMNWMIEKRVIIAHFSGMLTHEVLCDSLKQSQQWSSNALAPVHHIWHSAALTSFAVPTKTYQRLLWQYLAPTPQSWHIEVTSKSYPRLTTTIAQGPAACVHVANTLAAAMAFLQQQDASLHGLAWTTTVHSAM